MNSRVLVGCWEGFGDWRRLGGRVAVEFRGLAVEGVWVWSLC